jgi:3-methyladenine DNA glycosylase Tag
MSGSGSRRRPSGPPRVDRSTIPATTPTSVALSKDLKKRGWTFVGPTTVYAFMQAMGLVNDHLRPAKLPTGPAAPSLLA